ncbi:MAG: HlyC/CorC family transporter [Flavobacteriales bacterium]|nr:HlyC/CorC family transporter [Flavobacteriales bacterium]
MDPEPGTYFLIASTIILVSLIFSGLFSGIEIAFVSSNRLMTELDKKKGIWGAGILSFFYRYPKFFIASMLIGNNMALVIYSYFAGDVLLAGIWGTHDINETAIPVITLLVQTIITTLVVLFVAEFIPKALFRSKPNRWLYLLAIPLIPILLVLFVPSIIVTLISMGLLMFFRKSEHQETQVEFGKVDLDHFLRHVTENAESEEDLDHEIQIFQNALDFASVKARECMIPRNEIVALEINDTIQELKALFVETGLSKIIIYRDNIDNIIGYVHSYELFKKPEGIKNVLLPVAIVPEPMPANEVLEILSQSKKNMAVVVDEFGGTSGIITMEDIVEEIFGEIEDEHDVEDLTEKEISEDTYVLSARLEVDYLIDKYKLDLPEHDEYDTLGGLVIHYCEEIPDEGTEIEVGPYTIRTISVSETRIEEVMIFPTA